MKCQVSHKSPECVFTHTYSWLTHLTQWKIRPIVHSQKDNLNSLFAHEYDHNLMIPSAIITLWKTCMNLEIMIIQWCRSINKIKE